MQPRMQIVIDKQSPRGDGNNSDTFERGGNSVIDKQSPRGDGNAVAAPRYPAVANCYR